MSDQSNMKDIEPCNFCNGTGLKLSNRKLKSKLRNHKDIQERMVSDTAEPRKGYSKKIRLPGSTNSKQNKLRQSLYQEVWERIPDAMSKGYYLEVISYVESIMSDRMFALVQSMRHGEEMQYPMMTAAEAATALRKEIKNRNTSLDVIDQQCRDTVTEIESKWSQERNIDIHNFVVVTHQLDQPPEARNEHMEKTADWGIDLARRISNDTRRAINRIKKASF